jgi:phosphomannomutase
VWAWLCYLQDKDGVAAAAAFAEMAAEQYSKPGSPTVAQRLEELYNK